MNNRANPTVAGNAARPRQFSQRREAHRVGAVERQGCVLADHGEAGRALAEPAAAQLWPRLADRSHPGSRLCRHPRSRLQTASLRLAEKPLESASGADWLDSTHGCRSCWRCVRVSRPSTSLAFFTATSRYVLPSFICIHILRRLHAGAPLCGKCTPLCKHEHCGCRDRPF